MKVLYVINSLEGGGAERIFSKVVNYARLYKNNVNNQVCLLDDKSIKYNIEGDIKNLDAGGSFLHSFVRLYKYIRLNKPDLIVSFLTRANICCLICGVILGVPVVISERVNTSSHFGHGVKSKIYNLIVRMLYVKAKKIIAVSSGVKKDLIDTYNIPEGKIEVIYNPVDVDGNRRLAVKNKGVNLFNNYIVCIGRLVKNKNFNLIINSAININSNVLIIGFGEEKDKLQEEINKKGLHEKVKILDFQENPFPFIYSARFFVLTSNAEGFPNALVEAMSLGKAIIATDCNSGPREILSPKTNVNHKVINEIELAEFGVLVPVNNKEKMIEAIKLLEEDVGVLKRYEESSFIRSHDFDEGTILNSYMELIYT